MCIDAKTSATAFVIGTLFNIMGLVYYKGSENYHKYVAIALVWEHVLLMQVADFIAWNCPVCGTLGNKIATSLAYFANITQPLVIYLSLMQVTDTNLNTRITASILLLIYMAYMLVNSIFTFGKYEMCLKPTSGCNNLDYYWWKNDSKAGMIYYTAVIGLILLLYRPFSFALFESAYITLALLTSGLIYKCGVPSVWCLFASLAPVFNLFLFKKVHS